MSDNTEKQKQEAGAYFKKNEIPKLFEIMLRELTIAKPEDPVQFLIDVLSRPSEGFRKCAVIGKPNAGKKTLAEAIAKDFNLVHIAMDLEFSKNEEAKKFQAKGDEIPAKVAMKILQSKYTEECKMKGWIVSGFPQNRAQALEMQQNGLFPDTLLLLDVEDEVSIQRATNPAAQEKLRKTELPRCKLNLDSMVESFKQLQVIQTVDGSLPKGKVFSRAKEALNGEPQVPKYAIIGKPGAGKSVCAEVVSSVLGVVKIHPNDAVVRAMNNFTELGQKARIYWEKKQKVPDSLMFEILEQRLKEKDCLTKGWVLDGYPVTPDDAKMMTDKGIFPDKVVVMDVDDSQVSSRCQNRRIDPESGKIYNTKWMPAPTKEIEKRCIQHPSDNDLAAINTRLKLCNKDLPMINQIFEGAIAPVNGNYPYENVVVKVLQGLYGQDELAPRILIVGPPCSGKRTLAFEFKKNMFSVPIVVGPQLVEDHIRLGTKLGDLAKPYFQSGSVIPDNIYVDIVRDRLLQPDCLKNGWILLNFPITKQHARLMVEKGLVPAKVIDLRVGDAQILERITGRLYDPVKQMTYHQKFNYPTDKAVAARLVKRAKEDTAEYANNERFRYAMNINSILTTLEKHATIHKINGAQEIRKVRSESVNALDGRKPVLKLLIIGPPAVGKGTQCEVIKERYGVLHLSTGEILRANVRAGTEIGKRAKPFMESGLLVPDELILDMLYDRLQQEDVKVKGWLLDGFPRTPNQAQFMVSKGIFPDAVILLTAADQVVVDRISGRRTDPQTGNVYHLIYNPPPAEAVPRLLQRADDTEEKIRVRLGQYHENLQGILKEFPGNIFSIDGAGKKEVVTKQVTDAIDSTCAANFIENSK